MAKKKVAERTSGGKFPKGVSGNPLGRPKGSKNKVTLLKLIAEQAVREDNTEDMLKVARLIVEQALEGDSRSQKLVWDSMMSKGSTDEKASGSEKVEINIGGIAPVEPKEVIIVTEEPQDGRS
jgi:hypothetical protein